MEGNCVSQEYIGEIITAERFEFTHHFQMFDNYEKGSRPLLAIFNLVFQLFYTFWGQQR
jgi:hypothetical protein